jgi:hypothetical protein
VADLLLELNRPLEALSEYPVGASVRIGQSLLKPGGSCGAAGNALYIAEAGKEASDDPDASQEAPRSLEYSETVLELCGGGQNVVLRTKKILAQRSKTASSELSACGRSQ